MTIFLIKKDLIIFYTTRTIESTIRPTNIKEPASTKESIGIEEPICIEKLIIICHNQ